MNTVGRYCQEHAIETVNFLKADVEGHELDVFKGARCMMSQGQIQPIQFEYGACNIDAGAALKDLFAFLDPLGCMLFKMYPQGIRRFERYGQRLEDSRYQNWVTMRGRP